MSRLFMHFLCKGYGPKLSLRLARNRKHESRATGAAIATKAMRKASAETIARRILEQNIFGVTK